ncbi:DUF2937 family protein [Hyphococcus formosus]|uniref:DUF2937 family protein n=1 Tax=Hyphococcus formosus TaxID=3143534 RepID=UPI00398B7605
MGRFLAMLLGVAGAVLGSQGPGFTLQYMQNLQGRIDELRPIVEEFDANIEQYNYTRDQALTECRTATGLLDALCTTYVSTVQRYELLTAHMAKLESVDDNVRPLILARTQMRDITTSVYEQYKPAIPTTIDGAIYAGGGFAVLWGGASFIFGLLGSMFGGRRYA